jgi:hypothetical protein
MSLINSASSGGGILSFAIILKEVPFNAVVRNKGYYTYCKY